MLLPSLNKTVFFQRKLKKQKLLADGVVLENNLISIPLPVLLPKQKHKENGAGASIFLSSNCKNN